jgi:hypothetical protein
VGAAVVRGENLEVLDLAATIPVPLMRTSGTERSSSPAAQVVQGPLTNLVNGAIGSAVTVSSLAIAFLQEALIIALQLVVEDHAANVTAAVSDLLGGARTRGEKCESCAISGRRAKPA